jgi:hypothetical protein
MANTVSVDPKGEQRGGQEVYIIDVSRDGTTLSVENTRREMGDMVRRENLRLQRLRLEREEAVKDGQPVAVIDAEIATTADLSWNATTVYEFMPR